MKSICTQPLLFTRSLHVNAAHTLLKLVSRLSARYNPTPSPSLVPPQAQHTCAVDVHPATFQYLVTLVALSQDALSRYETRVYSVSFLWNSVYRGVSQLALFFFLLVPRFPYVFLCSRLIIVSAADKSGYFLHLASFQYLVTLLALSRDALPRCDLRVLFRVCAVNCVYLLPHSFYNT